MFEMAVFREIQSDQMLDEMVSSLPGSFTEQEAT